MYFMCPEGPHDEIRVHFYPGAEMYFMCPEGPHEAIRVYFYPGVEMYFMTVGNQSTRCAQKRDVLY